MTSISGSTTRPPLNPASGARSASGSTSIDMPRGGLPLVTAKWIPASCSFWAASTERAVSSFCLRDERPVDVGEQQPDHFMAR